jgi:hypothetical protein
MVRCCNSSCYKVAISPNITERAGARFTANGSTVRHMWKEDSTVQSNPKAAYAPPIPEAPHASTAPRLFTTEDVLELHVRSGRAVINAVLTALRLIPVCRLASPGEFTRCAYDGGSGVQCPRQVRDGHTHDQERQLTVITDRQ